MIRICYSPRQDCEIAGAPVELRAIAAGISELAARKGGPVVFDADFNLNPHPYDRALRRLVISAGSGPVRACVVESDLCIAGSSESLGTFASSFDFPDDVPAGYHLHREYYDGNLFIAEDSVPLVICASLWPT